MSGMTSLNYESPVRNIEKSSRDNSRWLSTPLVAQWMQKLVVGSGQSIRKWQKTERGCWQHSSHLQALYRIVNISVFLALLPDEIALDITHSMANHTKSDSVKIAFQG